MKPRQRKKQRNGIVKPSSVRNLLAIKIDKIARHFPLQSLCQHSYSLCHVIHSEGSRPATGIAHVSLHMAGADGEEGHLHIVSLGVGIGLGLVTSGMSRERHFISWLRADLEHL